MKLSRVCTGILSYENDAKPFNFSKTAKSIKNVHRVHKSSKARGTNVLLQTSLPLTRNLKVKVTVELYSIFSKISKIGQW